MFHLIKAEYGLKSLQDKRLRISRILELNDPFEFLSLEMSDRELRQPFMAARQEIARRFGLLCFSADWRNPVQWAHYADRHRGLCLGFEIPEDCLEKVDYVDEREHLQGELTEAKVIALLKVKYRDWAYEQEYRAFVPLETSDGNHFFSDFSSNLILKQVIVGAESTLTRSDLASALGDVRVEIDVFKARAAFQKFQMTRNMNEAHWA